MFSSLWPQSYPSQGRGPIFCTRLLLYLGTRGLRKCDPSHTFRPSNMKRNIGDPYRSSGPWGAGNPAVRGDFAIALINLMPDPTSGCQPGPPSFGDPSSEASWGPFSPILWPRSENDDFGPPGAHFPRFCGQGSKTTILDLLGPIFADSCGPGPKMTILDLLGTIFADSAAQARKRRFRISLLT